MRRTSVCTAAYLRNHNTCCEKNIVGWKGDLKREDTKARELGSILSQCRTSLIGECPATNRSFSCKREYKTKFPIIQQKSTFSQSKCVPTVMEQLVPVLTTLVCRGLGSNPWHAVPGADTLPTKLSGPVHICTIFPRAHILHKARR